MNLSVPEQKTPEVLGREIVAAPPRQLGWTRLK
jgi:hypothetical protein